MQRRFLIAVPAALAAAFVFTVAAMAQYVSADDNTNRRGGDYRNFELSTPDPGLCRNACGADSQCLAFTYVKPGVQGPNARCWLKNPAPPSNPEDCCVSGVKSGASGVVPAGELEYGVNRGGGDYRSFDVGADPAQCRVACFGEAQCLAFTYVQPGVQGPNARCWLKSSIPAPGRNDCCVSGVKGPGGGNSGTLQVVQTGAGAVRVTWSGKPGGASDWVSVVSAGAPEGDAGRWYTAASPSGAQDFNSLPPGQYEARFHLNNGYAINERVSFSVN